MAIRGKSAIVVGGSMAGLLAAAVLAEHFDAVHLVERDALDTGAAPRKGVPQGQHVHGFWHRGFEVVERLLPGVRTALAAAGASQGDAGLDLRWHQFDATKLPCEAFSPVLLATRPLLESEVRRRVLALRGVVAHAGVSVESLLAGDAQEAGPAVRGVVLRDEDGAELRLDADLVVDASGRSGQAVRWLQALGFEPPAESEVRIDVSYVSRFFERSHEADAIGHIVASTPPQGRRGGVAFAVDGGRWLVTLIGFMGEEPPRDDAGFRDFARSLPSPAIHGIVSRERALDTPAAGFKFPRNLRRHYERLQRFPERLLVIGDALASFNPAYGQGMTVAALEAEQLQQLLAQSSDLVGLGRRYFARVRPVVDVPWMITTGEDLRYPEATGQRPPWLGLVNGYFTRVHRAAAVDAQVARSFLQVAGFQAAPATMFAPGMVWRALRGARRWERARQALRAAGAADALPDAR